MIDASNAFLVGGRGDRIVIGLHKRELTHDEALTLAAWLVALTGKREAFLELLDAVEGT